MEGSTTHPPKMNTLLRPDRVRWSIRQGLIVLCCLASLLQAEDQTRPSFLFLIADDMSPNLGCYGDPDAKTPNLDAFAASSIRYTRAFSARSNCRMTSARSRSPSVRRAIFVSTAARKISILTPKPMFGMPNNGRKPIGRGARKGSRSLRSTIISIRTRADSGKAARPFWSIRQNSKTINGTTRTK